MRKEISEVNCTFGSNLAVLRKKFNLSRKALAEKVDADEILIGAYERGERTPKFPRLIQFADLFGVSVDELLRGKICLEEKTNSDFDIKKLLDKDFVLPFFSVKKFNPETFLTLLVDDLNIPVDETSTNTDIRNFLYSCDSFEESLCTYRLNQLLVLIGRVEKLFKTISSKRYRRIVETDSTLRDKVQIAEKANNKELAEIYSAVHKKFFNVVVTKYVNCLDSISAEKEVLEFMRRALENRLETIYRHNFSQYLKRGRQNKKLTQSDLAKLIGISQSGIADYEGARRSPNLIDLKKFAEIFNLPNIKSILQIKNH